MNRFQTRLQPWKLMTAVDRVLRGEYAGSTQGPSEGKRLSPLLAAGSVLLLGAIYGVFMGLYGATRVSQPSYLQIVACVVKVPMLFLVTLGVTFPSLYVSSVLAGSPLRLVETLRLLLLGIVVNLALLASLGPITAFFTMSTTSYPFMVLLNTAFFAVAGLAGLSFLRRSVSARFKAPTAPGEEKQKPRPRLRARRVFWWWTLLYATVGAQTAWILRPFIGSPSLPFSWFRDREANVFLGILRALSDLVA